MPTRKEREYYRMGFKDGQDSIDLAKRQITEMRDFLPPRGIISTAFTKKKRKLSAWNKFVKANSSKPRFRLRSGSPNLKKLGVAFRKTPAGKKKRR